MKELRTSLNANSDFELHEFQTLEKFGLFGLNEAVLNNLREKRWKGYNCSLTKEIFVYLKSVRMQ